MARAGWVLLAGAAALLPLVTANTYYLYLAGTVALLAIVTAGLNVLAGFAGEISLGHAGFYAIGAYTAALGATRLGWPASAAALAAVIAAALSGAAVAAAALRVTGPYLAMVTIAFGIIVEGVLVEWVSLTGGPGGVFNIPKPPLARYYWLLAASAALALWLTANLRRSPWGRALLAVKGSDIAAESLGLSAYRVRIAAFAVSAAFTGGAGALFAFLNGYISPDSFTLQTSILFLLALLFGGMGTIAGPVVGSLALTILPELLTGLTDYRLMLYGALLLASMSWLPAGVVGALARRRTSARPASTRTIARRAPDDNARVARRPDGPVIGAEGVSVRFGGVAALVDVTLAVCGRGIHAVIGPNGAGKTTLLNVLSGFYAPDAGSVVLDGRPVTGRPPWELARRGVTRTFQTAQLFPELTALDNVAVGVAGGQLGSLLGALARSPAGRRRDAELRGRAQALLEDAELAEWAEMRADALPAGLQRRVEIARALAANPRVLMLDEPAAGLGPVEIDALGAQLTALSSAGGPAIVLVEHHMDLVMAISERITVLDRGHVIASGSPAAVRDDPAVIEAYLGMPA